MAKVHEQRTPRWKASTRARLHKGPSFASIGASIFEQGFEHQVPQDKERGISTGAEGTLLQPGAWAATDVDTTMTPFDLVVHPRPSYASGHRCAGALPWGSHLMGSPRVMSGREPYPDPPMICFPKPSQCSVCLPTSPGANGNGTLCKCISDAPVKPRVRAENRRSRSARTPSEQALSDNADWARKRQSGLALHHH